MIKKTENMSEHPLEDFLNELKETIKHSNDVNKWVNNIENDEDLENKANELYP